MDLGNDTSQIGRYDGRSVGELLGEIRAEVTGRHASQVREWVAIVAWADQNTVDTPEGAATLVEGVIDTGVPIAGPGAPLVSEFALMELIAVLGRSPDGGRVYVGQVIECAWRLQGVHAAVVEGRLEPWRAQRIADLTHALNPEAAGFVDRQLAAVGGIGWAQLERLVTEAMLRFDPEAAEKARQSAADDRYFDIDVVDANGQTRIHGVTDAADGHDLHLALARRAEILAKLGDESSLDVRRSKAAGELARADLALDLLFADDETRDGTGEVTATSPGRKVVLNVHITDTTLQEENPFANPVGRWDETHAPISTAQIKEWLRAHDTTVIVRPVIDLADCVAVDSYEIPDRIRRRVELRDHHCRFPNCTRRANRCDLDHATPHANGGPTCPCNLVPLCRRHHRAKTFSDWSYLVTEPGSYLWTSPHNWLFLVDHRGTRTLGTPRRVAHPDPPDL